MPIYELDGERPELPEEGQYWIAETAVLIGRVRLRRNRIGRTIHRRFRNAYEPTLVAAAVPPPRPTDAPARTCSSTGDVTPRITTCPYSTLKVPWPLHYGGTHRCAWEGLPYG